MNKRQISLKAKLTYAFSLIPLMILVLAGACFFILEQNTSAMAEVTRKQFEELFRNRAMVQAGMLRGALMERLAVLASRIEARVGDTAIRALVSGGESVPSTAARGVSVPERAPDHASSEGILSAALRQTGASFLTIVNASGRTVARATNPSRTGDDLFGREGTEGNADLRGLVEKALKGRIVTSVEPLGPQLLREEIVNDANAIAGVTNPGDTLADQARAGDEGRGLTLLAACPIAGLDGRVAGVAFAGILLNRNQRFLDSLSEPLGESSFTALTLGAVRVLTSEPGLNGKPNAAGVPLGGDVWSRFQQDPANAVGDFDTGRGERATMKLEPLRDHRDKPIGALVAGVSANLAAQMMGAIDAGAEAARSNAKNVIFQIGLIIFALTMVVGYTLSVRITGPIQYLIEVSRAITAGDYGRRAEIDSGDEFGALAAAFNVMAATINEKIQRAEALIREIKESIARMGGSAGDISAIVARQVAGATEQAASVNEVTTTSEEIAATARQIADNAASVKDIANEATRACQKGTEDITMAISGMAALKEHVQSIAESMLVLGKNSQKIGEVINIIDEISKQTNLLSLNAAIEAAGAGEEGKRFAVVAVEVKRLADRTVDATKQIKQLIDMIQNSTNKTILLTEEGSKSVDSGFEQVEQVGKSLEGIVTLVKKTARAANEISLSTGQQTTATDSMAQSISDVSRVAAQVLKSSEETRKSVGDINDLSDQLRKLVGEESLGPSRQG